MITESSSKAARTVQKWRQQQRWAICLAASLLWHVAAGVWLSGVRWGAAAGGGNRVSGLAGDSVQVSLRRGPGSPQPHAARRATTPPSVSVRPADQTLAKPAAAAPQGGRTSASAAAHAASSSAVARQTAATSAKKTVTSAKTAALPHDAPRILAVHVPVVPDLKADSAAITVSEPVSRVPLPAATSRRVLAPLPLNPVGQVASAAVMPSPGTAGNTGGAVSSLVLPAAAPVQNSGATAAETGANGSIHGVPGDTPNGGKSDNGVRGLPFSGSGSGGGAGGAGNGHGKGSGGNGTGLPVHAVYVLDCSGSMRENNKIAYARQALTRAMEQLGPGDTFDIVTFNDDARLLWPDFQPATPRTIRDAVRRINDLELPDENVGTTNYGAAFAAATRLRGETHIFFITDGIPSSGVGVPNEGAVDFAAIRAYVRAANRQNALIFTFAISDKGSWTQDFLKAAGDSPLWEQEARKELQNGITLLHDLAADTGGDYRFVDVLRDH